MIHLHQNIWEKLGPYCSEMNRYYSPSLWMPHITLALNDLNKKNLACAIDTYAFEKIELSVKMTNLALAELQDQKIGKILQRFPVVK
jgi:2'-5' RNA ligase